MLDTKVINIRNAPPNWRAFPETYVYIGRPGPWGNPYPMAAEDHRASVIARYMEFLTVQLERNALLRSDIRLLKGKTLVCYCAPKACHGDVLAMLAHVL